MSSREYFAQVAGDWDRLRAGFFSTAVREAALTLAGVRAGHCPGQTAADLGAGTGFVTEALLAAGLSVACVDQSPQMLATLRAKFGSGRTGAGCGGASGGGRLTTLEGQAEALPLPEASVDFVFANMFLHHVDDPGQAILEMARVVRPGGRVVLTDLDSHNHAFLLTEHHDRWPGFARADIAAWFRAAGLVNVQVQNVQVQNVQVQNVQVGNIQGANAQAESAPAGRPEGQTCCADSSGQAQTCCADSGGRGEVCCAESCDGSDKAQITIFAAHATRPLCAIPAAQADPLAVGARARALFAGVEGDAAPLLCAESVLQAVAEALGVHSPLIPRLATGFCSGLSRTCGPCGALSGGVMALGLALGRDSGRDDLDEAYGPVQEYLEFFSETFGSANCLELTGCDFGTAAGQSAFRQRGVKQDVCLPLVAAAAAQVVRILAEHQTVYLAAYSAVYPAGQRAD
ncbi:MAG: hypothetical protein A2051_01420 [Desulfovibrionales bacterium GWA2_65_9]|nr:MAG: hypothetical protein A2051_01420 [Desulfovibrionales bacterium GWA2_65_9]